MRTGDTICGADGRMWYVDEVGWDSCVGAELDSNRPKAKRRKKTFSADKLECVDQDDGIWQEIQ